MNDVVLSPYLIFSGNAREAMEFYQSVLGGDLQISTFKDFEGPEMPVPEGYDNKVMHASLTTDRFVLMASDSSPDTEAKRGDSFGLSLSGSDDEQLTTYFESLSEGGDVTMPIAKQIWGDRFGMLTDKFGIAWFININSPQSSK